MYEEIENGFDLKVRELLDGAEVKPSRGVWKAVSSRISPEPVRTAAPVWMWTCAGLAAAALAVALVVPGIFRTPGAQPETLFVAEAEFDGTILTNNIESLLAEAEPVEVLPAVSSEEHVAFRDVSATSRDAVDESMARFTAAPAGETADAAGVEPAADAVPAGNEGSAAKPSTVVKESAEVDPFAIMALEDRFGRTRRKTAVTFGGSICGNDSDASSVRVGSYCLDGEGSGLVKGISENGESVYGIPLSIGVGVRFYLGERLSLGTGLDYSALTRSFLGTYTEEAGVPAKITNGETLHTMQYIGVPVNLYYDIVRRGDFLFYVYGGGMAERALSNKYRIRGANGEASFTDPVKGLQYSVGAGLGVEFKLGDRLGLYLDPGARYYFDCGQPRSIRTARPYMISFDAGLRFDF